MLHHNIDIQPLHLSSLHWLIILGAADLKMGKCEFNHTIPNGEVECAEGHPQIVIAAAAAENPMERMMAMMEAQQNQLREQQEQMNNAMRELLD